MLSAGFATLEQLKESVLPEELISETNYDNRLRRIGKGVAEQINRHCGRVFQRGEGITFDETANRTSVSLPRYPLENIIQVTLDYGGELSDYTADIETISKSAGIIQFYQILGSYDDRVEVTYTGGYWLDDGTPQPEGVSALPWDIIHAHEIQCQMVIEHTNLLGTASARTDKEGRGQPKLRDLTLSPDVKSILRPHVRFA